jgi:RNA polymerase I-specific transcription initiation factor RRN7
MTKRLARVLSLPLTLHHSLSPGLKQIRKRDPEKHKFDHIPPELALISTAVVVLKLVYGLDSKPRLLSVNSNLKTQFHENFGTSRFPTGPDDPACALPNPEQYLSVLNAIEESSAKDDIFSTGKNMSVPILL